MNDDRAIAKQKQREYAKAMLLMAIKIGEQKEALRVRNDLRSILYSISQDYGLIDSIDSRKFAKFRKDSDDIDLHQIIKFVFKGASKATLNVLEIMVENRDFYLLPLMFEVYDSLLEKYYRVVVVDVTTAIPLDDELREIIKKKAQNDLDSNIILNEQVNKDILGGVILSAKHKTVDASLRSVLINTKNRLTSIYKES